MVLNFNGILTNMFFFFIRCHPTGSPVCSCNGEQNTERRSKSDKEFVTTVGEFYVTKWAKGSLPN